MAGVPQVSILMAAYNAAPYVGAAIGSALAQTYRDLELVVVDDGSTDGTVGVVEGLAAADARVRLVRQPNRGVAAARNRALAESRGELVAPLDADDVWFPQKLERQVARLAEAGAGVGLVYGWWARIDEAGCINYYNRREYAEGDVLHGLIERYFLGNASTPLIRRSVLDQVGGYNESMLRQGGQGCEDWDLALRVAERSRFAVVPEYLVQYRDAGGSMTRQYRRMKKSYDMMIDDLRRRRPDVPEAVLRRSRSRFLLYLAKVSFSKGSKRHAVDGLLRAAAADPRVVLSDENRREIAQGAANHVRRVLRRPPTYGGGVPLSGPPKTAGAQDGPCD